jgi:hypothetical protein
MREMKGIKKSERGSVEFWMEYYLQRDKPDGVDSPDKFKWNGKYHPSIEKQKL